MCVLVVATSMLCGGIGFHRTALAGDVGDPKVIRAVAPVFVPFVLNETGYETVSIEVEIDSSGNVVSAKTVNFTLFQDRSIEEAAMKWKFERGEANNKVRKAVLKFAFRIMPDDTNVDDLGTIFNFPYEIEVRSKIIKSRIIADPVSKKP